MKGKIRNALKLMRSNPRLFFIMGIAEIKYGNYPLTPLIIGV